MKYSITTHKIIAIVSFIVLSSVQFFLLYNTYELENDRYYSTEKGILNLEYTAAVKNDKLFPGGQRIMDNFIYANMSALEQAYKTSTAEFSTLKQKMCDSAFAELRKANNTDSLLSAIIKRHHLNRDLEYALLVNNMEIIFQHQKYINLYNPKEHYPLINDSIQTEPGIRIGGKLREVSENNRVSKYYVNSPLDYSYSMSFALHVDVQHRQLAILKLMMRPFLLSLFSVGAVVLLFFITFRNWLRQKKLSEMKSDFINSITHEFHTPLAAIIVANKTMQNEKIITSRENIKPLTEVVQRQAERLRVLISQVLQITTMNTITLQKEDHSIHLLLDEILLDYRLKLTGTSTNFSLHKGASRDVVSLDRFWFTTIILNIFDNAVKYNDKDPKEIIVTTSDDRKGIHIMIQDNGIGMTPEIKKHIFEKFYRNTSHVGSQVKGLGLGMYYVKQALEAHDWEIGVESVEGRGSAFIISIPL